MIRQDAPGSSHFAASDARLAVIRPSVSVRVVGEIGAKRTARGMLDYMESGVRVRRRRLRRNADGSA